MRTGKFVICASSAGEFYFVLKSVNGEIIATSEMYGKKAGCKRGIAAVQKYAKTAKIEEELQY